MKRLFPLLAMALVFVACNDDSGVNTPVVAESSSAFEPVYSSAIPVYSSAAQVVSSSSIFVVSSSSVRMSSAVSSSSVKSSSSVVASSSATSSASAGGLRAATTTRSYESAWTYMKQPASKYQEFTDSRDGIVYRAVKIGTQTWMAENLNYAGAGECLDGKSSCDVYGRYYDWAEVMGVSSSYLTVYLGDSINHQGICPKGWHVPSMSEWAKLKSTVGSASKVMSAMEDMAGGTDYYGFNALAAGGLDCHGMIMGLSDDGETVTETYFWTSVEEAPSHGRYNSIKSGDSKFYNGYSGKEYKRSLRCVMD